MIALVMIVVHNATKKMNQLLTEILGAKNAPSVSMHRLLRCLVLAYRNFIEPLKKHFTNAITNAIARGRGMLAPISKPNLKRK